MGQGDARVGGGAGGRRDPGNELVLDAVPDELLRFFRPAPVNQGVAPLEPGHLLAGPGFFHEKPVDLILLQGMVMAGFSRVDDFAPLAGILKEFLIGQIVVDDHIRVPDAFDGPQGNQLRMARACADQKDFARPLVGCHGYTSGGGSCWVR